ncbi:EAL domain, c-di-GMP-specific phosphodiesterase class I (or its enzymatically inactive variant) [Lachnospiraceae bacterium NE2001]|nr:EAL domain, c-di-GMP-specific phosphodiesterase class I (or its enzymatically inactive variant) [Lachnospiraceae bacterium NE2001]
MAKKRLALLLGQADESYQQEFIRGVKKRAFEQGYDVLVFSMYIKYQNTKEREVGDSNIFNLINFSLFDAVIILSDTIQTPEVEKRLEERIYREFNGPVVCIDTESKYFYSFWTDGYPMVYATVSHIIEEHGAKDIAYLTGRKQHVHSIRRLEAFKDAMRDHGLEIQPGRMHYGDFWYTSGTGFAEKFFHSGETLPEAIVCANDNMAIGVAEELERRGVKIPDDVLLAGFGTCEEGQLSPKSLTSSYLPTEYYGTFAVDALDYIKKGEKVPELNPEAKLFLGESCGCDGKPEEKYFSKRQKWMTADSEEGYYSIHNYMLEDLLAVSDLEEYFRTVYENIFYLRGVKRLEICLNSGWINENVLVDNDFPEKGYSHTMINILSYNHKHPEYSGINTQNLFETSKLLPYINDDDEPVCLIFSPLYVENKSFGYAMIRYDSELKSFEEVTRLWLNMVAKGLESLRRSYAIRLLEKRTSNKLQVKFPTDESKKAAIKNQDITEEEAREIKEVEKILDENLLTYHFQPIVNSVDGEIYSYEALMRSNSEWKIPPLQIIKDADILGRLSDIERATFINVLNIVEDRASEFEGKKVFINSIPGSKLEYNDFVQIEKLLKKNHEKTVVELTEQAELLDEDFDQLKEQYNRLGIEMAVDDYGTGYSNVSNLLRYMPNYVKIDRSLLSEIQNSTQKQHFVREIIDFCHSNNILALAEGVETSEELRTVIRLGADLIQGYYVARPAAEVIPSVDGNVKMEIARFHREREDGASEMLYKAGRTSRVSISNLERENKNTIIIGDKESTFRDITIVGTPNRKSDIHIEILEDYDGRVTLENVSLSNIKNRPCINIAENSKLTLRLEGENRFEGGGIAVPETSKLTVEGDGNLKLILSGAEIYGIGNGIDKGHGTLEFYQDGEITLESNGQTTIGIGSGLGGTTRICKGKYTFHLNGDEGVGIGSLRGNQYLEVHDCDLMMDNGFYKGVCIGNLENNSGVNIWRSLIRLTGSGKRLSMLGTVDGERSDIYIHDMSFITNIRAEYATSMGSLSGSSNIKVEQAALKYKGVGRQAFVYGGVSDKTTVDINDVDIHVTLDSDSGKQTNAPEENIRKVKETENIIINGKQL